MSVSMSLYLSFCLSAQKWKNPQNKNTMRYKHVLWWIKIMIKFWRLWLESYVRILARVWEISIRHAANPVKSGWQLVRRTHTVHYYHLLCWQHHHHRVTMELQVLPRRRTINNDADDLDLVQYQPRGWSGSRDLSPVIIHDLVSSPWKRFRPSNTDDVAHRRRRPLSTSSRNLRDFPGATRLFAATYSKQPNG